VLGLFFVALLLAWLVKNAVDTPQDFFNVLLIGLTTGAVYALVALGYTLVYGILQLINFAHGDVFALSGLFATTMIGGAVFNLTGATSTLGICHRAWCDVLDRRRLRRNGELDDRVRRLPAVA